MCPHFVFGVSVGLILGWVVATLVNVLANNHGIYGPCPEHPGYERMDCQPRKTP